MTLILVLVYLWAGATTLFALWQFEEIGQAVNGLLPKEKHLKRFLSSWEIKILFFVAWPIVLLGWVWIEYRGRLK